MYNVINVTFQGDTKQYAYLYDGPVKIGDMLQSQKGSAKVVNVYRSHSDSINGKKLKYFNEMKETNSMFGGFVNKYKSQFIPQKENGPRFWRFNPWLKSNKSPISRSGAEVAR